MLLQCGNKTLDLSVTQVMAVLNVTPDSFYDGGRFMSVSGVNYDHLLATAERYVNEGAAILDVGGESTRPDATPISEQEELDRVIPAVERLAQNLDVIISVDSSSAAVIENAARAGAGMINDARALRREGALAVAASTHLPVCLMHMRGTPQTMQQKPCYDDVLAEVTSFLTERVDACEKAGIARQRLLIDPGFGFGKTDEHNLALLAGLKKLSGMGLPILAGLSRKSMIGRLLGREPDQRLAGSLMLAVAAMHNGARILRVHDVAETVDVVTLYGLTLGQ